MKKLILVVLLALAPLSWGEDVWYCVEEHVAGLVENESSDSYKLKNMGLKDSLLNMRQSKTDWRLQANNGATTTSILCSAQCVHRRKPSLMP